MSDNAVSRRKILGAIALTTSTLAMGAPGVSLENFLKSPKGRETIRTILKKNVGLLSIPESTLNAFYESLMKGERTKYKHEFFLEHLDDVVLNERLEVFVIEEFLITTNYLHIVAGEVAPGTQLQMLTA